MPGGKAGAVELMKRLRAPSSGTEDQTGASGPRGRRGLFFFLFFFISYIRC